LQPQDWELCLPAPSFPVSHGYYQSLGPKTPPGLWTKSSRISLYVLMLSCTAKRTGMPSDEVFQLQDALAVLRAVGLCRHGITGTRFPLHSAEARA
jgi:hypothetical protein